MGLVVLGEINSMKSWEKVDMINIQFDNPHDDIMEQSLIDKHLVILPTMVYTYYAGVKIEVLL